MTELLRLAGHESQLAGALTVRRVLPAVAQRAVGPFVFFDHFGPVTLPPEAHTDVGGHPHIGLATVTYLLEGHMLHRDSLGHVQPISPGAINWMTAGKGIVHSERAVDEERGKERRLHGLQLWVALPPDLEQCEPSFQHVAPDQIPELTLDGGVSVRVLVGQAWGETSPVVVGWPTLYLDVCLPPGTTWTLPPLADERAIYSPQDPLTVDDQTVPPREMVVLPSGQATHIKAGPSGARLVVVGGQALPQPVRMWWNFVSSDSVRIEEAAQRWAAGGFDAIPGETDRIAAPPWRGMRPK